MNLANIFYQILVNLIVFFTLESFTQYFAKKYYLEKKNTLRKAFIIFNIIYSILPKFPDIINLIVAYFSDFIYIYLISQTNLKQKISLYIKYWIFSYTAMFITYMLHSIITMDFIYSMENSLYNSYKDIICNLLIYIFLSAYTNTKMRTYDTKESKTIMIFNVLIVIMSLFIAVIPLILKLETEESQNLLILIFSILMILILLTLSMHKKMLFVLDENMKTKFELEANRLKKEYSEKLEENISELRKLRHDIKNHFIIINGYAHNNNTEKIISYITRITTEYSSYDTVTTPSDFVSSILSSKQQICKNQNIQFDILTDFQEIYFDDFDMLTILGNLLDNAIFASGKCENGFISLKISQRDSYLNIYCQNNHKEQLIEENHKLISTKKEDRQNHGLGLGNIQQIVEKENGSMHIKYDDSIFEVSITIPNYKK